MYHTTQLEIWSHGDTNFHNFFSQTWDRNHNWYANYAELFGLYTPLLRSFFVELKFGVGRERSAKVQTSLWDQPQAHSVYLFLTSPAKRFWSFFLSFLNPYKLYEERKREREREREKGLWQFEWIDGCLNKSKLFQFPGICKALKILSKLFCRMQETTAQRMRTLS